jgi:hypothetical protein
VADDAVKIEQLLPHVELFLCACDGRSDMRFVVVFVPFADRNVSGDGAQGNRLQAHLVRSDLPYRIVIQRPAPRGHRRTRHALIDSPEMIASAGLGKLEIRSIEIGGMVSVCARRSPVIAGATVGRAAFFGKNAPSLFKKRCPGLRIGIRSANSCAFGSVLADMPSSSQVGIFHVPEF